MQTLRPNTTSAIPRNISPSSTSSSAPLELQAHNQQLRLASLEDLRRSPAWLEVEATLQSFLQSSRSRAEAATEPNSALMFTSESRAYARVVRVLDDLIEDYQVS